MGSLAGSLAGSLVGRNLLLQVFYLTLETTGWWLVGVRPE